MPDGYAEVVRSIVVADLVDSTALAERLGAAAVAALGAAHDRVARDALAAWNGVEIDKTDGFLLLFEDVADAVGYAAVYHRAVSTLADADGRPLRARVGIHRGALVLRPNAPDDVARGAKPLEADGVAKAVAARVCSVARPGATLLTGDARDGLLRLPDGLRMAPQGHWQLKGVALPLELYEVGPAERAFAGPTDGAKAWRVVRDGDGWRRADEPASTLPPEPGPLLGRHADLAALAALFEEGARLVTIVGAAGCGKTRLACRYARMWLGGHRRAAWFCDASNARTADGVTLAVCAAVEVEGGPDPVRAVAGVLRSAEGLLVLDNLEQVVEHAPATVGRWLAGPSVIVATSREPLGLPEERVLTLEPLAPAAAVALFEARARAQLPTWSAERAAVERLVRALDLLPLAIELAAARVRVLSVEAIEARLADRLALLGPVKGLRSRYTTLRAAIDASWDLLDPPLREAFAASAIFEGSFDADTAEAVLGPGAIDRLQALVERSLVRSMPTPSGPRLSLLQSLRDYAAEKLRATDTRPLEERHGSWFARLGTPEALDRLLRHGAVTHLRALRAAFDDVVRACERAVGRGDVGVAVATLAAAAHVAPPVNVVPLARGARGMTALDGLDRARVLLVLGRALFESGQPDDGEEVLVEALEIGRSSGDEGTQVDALARLGLLRHQGGRGGTALMDEAIALARRSGRKRALGSLLNARGTLIEGDARAASRWYVDAVDVARELGDTDTEGRALTNLGSALIDLGDVDGARQHLEAGIAIHRERGNRRSEARALANLSMVLQDEGRIEEARDVLLDALATHRRVGNRRSQGLALGNLGSIELALGNVDVARIHFEAALAIARELGNRRTEARLLAQLATLAVEAGTADAADRLDEAEALLRAGGDADPLAILLCDRATLAIRSGEDPWPALAEARALSLRITNGPSPALVRRLEELDEVLSLN